MNAILPVGSLVHSFGQGFYNVNEALTVDIDKIPPFGAGCSIHTSVPDEKPPRIKYEIFDRYGPCPEYPKKILEGFAVPNDLFLATMLKNGYGGELCYYPVIHDNTFHSWSGLRSDSPNKTSLGIIVPRDYVIKNIDDFFVPLNSSKDLENLEAFFSNKPFPYRLKHGFNGRSTDVYVNEIMTEIRSRKLKPEGIFALIISKGFFEQVFRQLYEEMISADASVRRPVYSTQLELLFD